MDKIKLGPDEDSSPDFALNSYCRCLGYKAAGVSDDNFWRTVGSISDNF